MPKPETSATVKSAMRTLDILEFLVADGRAMAANEIAGALAIPISSLSYLLGTLVERGYLERSGRLYAPGPALARLASGRSGGLIERVAPIVRALNAQLNETAGFFVLRDHMIEAVASEIGRHALRYTLDVGQRVPPHAFAAGKAILAALDAPALDAYFRESERAAFTARTVTDEQALRAELEEIRRTGIAYTREEHTPGIIGMGCAAYVDGVVAGAFSVAMPLARFNADVEARTVALLKSATARLV